MNVPSPLDSSNCGVFGSSTSTVFITLSSSTSNSLDCSSLNERPAGPTCSTGVIISRYAASNPGVYVSPSGTCTGVLVGSNSLGSLQLTDLISSLPVYPCSASHVSRLPADTPPASPRVVVRTPVSRLMYDCVVRGLVNASDMDTSPPVSAA